MKRTLILTILPLITLLGCGQADDGEGTFANGRLVSDSALVVEGAGATIDDALEALAEEGATSVSLMTLTHDGEPADHHHHATRSCTVEGQSAVVLVEGEMNKSFSKENRRVSMAWAMSGQTSERRVWSRSVEDAAVAVACSESGKTAKIDWDDVAGLTLDLTFNRSRSRESTMTRLRDGAVTTRSRSFSASGTHQVAWSAQQSGDDGSTITREKVITSSATRSVSALNKQGKATDLKLMVVTKDGSPLTVAVVRSGDQKLVSKTIRSGVIVTSREGDGRMEMTYTDLKVDYTSGSCKLASGSVDLAVYGEGASAPTKTYKLAFTADDVSFVDVSTGETSDMDLPGCDPEDFAG